MKRVTSVHLPLPFVPSSVIHVELPYMGRVLGVSLKNNQCYLTVLAVTGGPPTTRRFLAVLTDSEVSDGYRYIGTVEPLLWLMGTDQTTSWHIFEEGGY